MADESVECPNPRVCPSSCVTTAWVSTLVPAAVLVQASPGTEAVIDAGGHILNYEEAAAAAWGGVQLRAVQTADGLLDPESVAAAIRPRTPYVVQTSLLCLENTHNSAGGRVLPVERMREVVEVARERGVAVHLDGARLPNASVAAGRADLCVLDPRRYR